MSRKSHFVVLHIICSLTFVLVSFQSGASTISIPIHYSDTTDPLFMPYHLNRIEFLNKYGKDDTSRALISFYFHKRSLGRKLIFFPFILDLVALAGFWLYFTYVTAPADGWAFTFFSIGFIASMAIFSIIGGIVLLTHSRKKLLQLLNEYNRGRSIPDAIRSNSYFKKQLQSKK
jgi:hypothetical protein